jgi:hypothetical protein
VSSATYRRESRIGYNITRPFVVGYFFARTIPTPLPPPNSLFKPKTKKLHVVQFATLQVLQVVQLYMQQRSKKYDFLND